MGVHTVQHVPNPSKNSAISLPIISDKWEIQEEASIIVKVQLYG